jgi:hypothetical protein
MCSALQFFEEGTLNVLMKSPCLLGRLDEFVASHAAMIT